MEIENTGINDTIIAKLREYEELENFKKPLGFSYFGGGDMDNISNMLARDFIEKGRGGYLEVGAELATISALSQQHKKEEEVEKLIESINKAKDQESIQQIIARSLQENNVPNDGSEDLMAAFAKIKNAADASSRHFIALAKKQNPVYSYLDTNSLGSDSREILEKTRQEAKIWGVDMESSNELLHYDGGFSALAEDIDFLNKNKYPPSRLDSFINASPLKNKKSIIDDPVKGTLIPALMRVKNDEDGMNGYSKDEKARIDKSIEIFATATPKHLSTVLLEKHDEAARFARQIASESFYSKGARRYTLGDSIPMVSSSQDGNLFTVFSEKAGEKSVYDKNIETSKKDHFFLMMNNAFRKMTEHDADFINLTKENPTLKSTIMEDLQNKIFSDTPNQKTLSAIFMADTFFGKIENKIDPSFRQEEQIGKIIEDSIYNSIMKLNGGESEYLNVANLPAIETTQILQNGIIDVNKNMVESLYYSGPGSQSYTEYEKAKEVSYLHSTFKELRQGKLSESAFFEKLNSNDVRILNEVDKQAVVSAVAQPYFQKNIDEIKSQDMGMSSDSKTRTMDVNGYLYQKDAQYIHQKLFKEGPLNKLLDIASFGMLERRSGANFLRCATSAQHATTRSQTTAGETKGCIDKLVDQYKRDAKETTQDIANPLVAMSGMSGLMLLFSAFEKAQAKKLERMGVILELKRQEALKFMDGAKTELENVTFMDAVKLSNEDVITKIVPNNIADEYLKEAQWAKMQHDLAFNPHLQNSELETNMSAATKQDAKSKIAFESIKTINDDLSLGTQIHDIMKEREERLKKESSIKIASLTSAIAQAHAEGNIVEEASLHKDLFNTRVNMLKDGVLPIDMAALDANENQSLTVRAAATVENVYRSLGFEKDESLGSGEYSYYHIILAQLAQTKDVISSDENRIEKIKEDINSNRGKGDHSQAAKLSLELEKVKSNIDNYARVVTALSKISEEMRESALSVSDYMVYSTRSINELCKKIDIKVDEGIKKGSPIDAKKLFDNSSPFAPLSQSFDFSDPSAFIQKNRGYVSTPFYAKSFMSALSDVQIEVSKTDPKNKAGQGMNAIRTVFAELLMQQTAEQRDISLKGAFSILYGQDKEMVSSMSNLKSYSVQQVNGKDSQIILFDRKNERKIYDPLFKGGLSPDKALDGYKTNREFEDLIYNKTLQKKIEFMRNKIGLSKEEIAEILSVLPENSTRMADTDKIEALDALSKKMEEIIGKKANKEGISVDYDKINTDWQKVAKALGDDLGNERAAQMKTIRVLASDLNERIDEFASSEKIDNTKFNNKKTIFGTIDATRELSSASADAIDPYKEDEPIFGRAYEESKQRTRATGGNGGIPST